MDIQLVRTNYTQWGVEGHLYINRKRICDTVEHPTRHLLEGDYIISSLGAIGSSFSATAHSKENLPSPFRHGDGALASLHGEIIVGKQLLPGVVTQSQSTYDRIYDRFKKAFQRGNTIRLKIIN